jgi:hypothetical protein
MYETRLTKITAQKESPIVHPTSEEKPNSVTVEEKKLNELP